MKKKLGGHKNGRIRKHSCQKFDMIQTKLLSVAFFFIRAFLWPRNFFSHLLHVSYYFHIIYQKDI